MSADGPSCRFAAISERSIAVESSGAFRQYSYSIVIVDICCKKNRPFLRQRPSRSLQPRRNAEQRNNREIWQHILIVQDSVSLAFVDESRIDQVLMSNSRSQAEQFAEKSALRNLP